MMKQYRLRVLPVKSFNIILIVNIKFLIVNNFV